VAKSGVHDQNMCTGRSLKVYRASRWSAVSLIGDTTKNISKREAFEGVSRLPLVGGRPHR
jgi:hypothetical protein